MKYVTEIFPYLTKHVLILIIKRSSFWLSFIRERDERNPCLSFRSPSSYVSIRVPRETTHKTNHFLHQATGFDRNSTAAFAIQCLLNASTVWLGVLYMTSMCLASKIWVYLHKIIQVKKVVCLPVSKVSPSRGSGGGWDQLAFYYQENWAVWTPLQKPLWEALQASCM